MQTITRVNSNLYNNSGGTPTLSRRNFPINGLEFYLPLWHPELSGTPVISKDLNAFSCAVTGTVHTPNVGRVYDGDDYVDLSNAISTIEAQTGGTIIVWANITDPTVGFNAMFSFSDTGDASSDFVFQVHTSDFRVRIRENGAGQLDMRSPGTAIGAATWYMYSLVVDGNFNAMYLDKTAQTPDYTTGNATTQKFFNSVGTPDSCLLGMNEDSTGVEWGVTGTIGEAYISLMSLTAIQIAHVYNSTKWRYK